MTPRRRWGVELDREGRARIVTLHLGPLTLWWCLANGNEEFLTMIGGDIGPIAWQFGGRDPGIVWQFGNPDPGELL